ncbi:MAG: hypothetical protein ACLR1T_04495 [Evtepia gabavorous]
MMRTMFDRLFAGRNGIDQLNIALFVLAILCWIGSLFAPTRGLANLLHWACPFWQPLLLCSCVFPELGTQAAGKPEISGYDPWISYRGETGEQKWSRSGNIRFLSAHPAE